MSNKYIAKVNPKFFHAISLFAAKNDIRYYLNGVFIEQHPEGGVSIVATNGHIMAAIHDIHGFTKRSIIIGNPSKELLNNCKSKKNTMLEPSSLWISERAAVICGSLENEDITTQIEEPELFGDNTLYTGSIKLLDGEFPDYKKLLNGIKPENNNLAFANGDYLSTFNQAAKILCGRQPAITFRSTGDSSTILGYISGELINNFISLIMPMESNCPDSLIPSWAIERKTTKSTKKKAA